MTTKTKKQSKSIENKESKKLGIKSITDVFNDYLSRKAKKIIYKLNNQENNTKYKRLSFKRDKYLEFDFRYYIPLRELFRDIYYKKFTIEEAEKSAR